MAAIVTKSLSNAITITFNIYMVSARMNNLPTNQVLHFYNMQSSILFLNQIVIYYILLFLHLEFYFPSITLFSVMYFFLNNLNLINMLGQKRPFVIPFFKIKC